MDIQIMILSIIVLIYSAIIHEYMHGWMAERLGDDTAKNEGRLTLNPIPHIDINGSIILPAILIMSGAPFLFGWAKPVPYNPNNLRDKIYGGAKVALAGPLANLIMALFFGMVLRAIFIFEPVFINQIMITFLVIIVQINLLLMVFNLLPIPPLDGSKVIMPFLPYHWKIRFLKMEQYGFFLVLAFVIFGFQYIIPVINFLFGLIVGV
ncbi:MAG: site-2 protease family protein [Bacteroidales bacterium]|nr:site-2 protease family protein [Bacteroidales bacterium]